MSKNKRLNFVLQSSNNMDGLYNMSKKKLLNFVWKP